MNDTAFDELLATLPTPLAVVLHDYAFTGPQRDLARLWRLCECVEVLLRLLAVLRLAELRATGWLDGNRAPAAGLARLFRRPTLASWRDAASAPRIESLPVPATAGSAQLPAVHRFIGARTPGPDVRFDVWESFIDLRNRLAHGAGLNDGAAHELLLSWEPRFRALVAAVGPWLATHDWLAAADDGAVVRLHGTGAAVLEPAAAGGVVLPDPVQPGHVWVMSAGRCLPLWPLLRFEPPADEEGRPRPGTARVVELYSRTDASSRPLYTALGSSQIDWSMGDQHATEALDGWLPAPEPVAESDAVESFRRELLEDAEGFVGREQQVDAALERLLGKPVSNTHGLHWLFAEAGMGKSFFMAKLFEQLSERQAAGGDPLVLVPYRFKLGDLRCSRLAFYELVSATLLQATPKGGGKPGSDKSFFEAALAACEKAGGRPLFLLDGLDEMAQADEDFVQQVLELAATGEKSRWLIASRPELETPLIEATTKPARRPYERLFEQGLEKMSAADMRALVIDRIGPKRSRLLEREQRALSEVRVLFDDMVATPELLKSLNGYRVPADLRRRLNEQRGHAAGAAGPGPAWSVSPIQRDRSWLFYDDNDDEVYYAQHDAERGRLVVRIDRISETPFVQQIVEMSDGHPLYVRYVIGEIRSGALSKLDGSEELPKGIREFYRRMLSRSSVSTLAQVSPQLLCLLAAAKEPLSALQLSHRQNCERWPILRDDETCSKALRYSHQTVQALAAMLREAVSVEDGQRAHTVYHHSLRDYLSETLAIQDTYQAARAWFADTECSNYPIDGDTCGSYVGYVARQGLAHLLERDAAGEEIALPDDLLPRRLQAAIRLVWYLHHVAQPQERKKGYVGLSHEPYRLPAGRLEDFRHQVFGAIESIFEAYDADVAGRAAIGEAVVKLLTPDQSKSTWKEVPPPVEEQLVSLAEDVYETGTQMATVRLLMQFSPEAWKGLRSRFMKPENIVSRLAVAEAEAAIYKSSSDDQKVAIWSDLMTRRQSADYEECEVANYALRYILAHERHPDEQKVLESWAASWRYVERMILGEYLVTLAMQADVERQLPEPSDEAMRRLKGLLETLREEGFFSSPWEYLRIDAREVLAWADPEGQWGDLVPESERKLGEQASALAHAMRQDLRDHLDSGRSADPVAAAARKVEVSFASLSFVRSDPVDGFIDAVREGGGATHLALVQRVFNVLLAHPLWDVGEKASLMVDRLVRMDGQFLQLLRSVLDKFEQGDPDPELWRRLLWRRLYGVVDASYNLSDVEEAKGLFERAVRLCHDHPVGRVRGICLDDFCALVKETYDEAEAGGTAEDARRACREFLERFDSVIGHWMRKASDCWELEYIFLLVGFVQDRGIYSGQALEAWLKHFGTLSPYLASGLRQSRRSEFLLAIEWKALRRPDRAT